MKLKEIEARLKNLNVVFGVLVMIFAFFIVLFSAIPIISLILLSIAIFTIGIANIINGSSNKELSQGLMTFKFVIGILALLFGVIIFFGLGESPIVALGTLILIMAIFFILIGIDITVISITVKDYSDMSRLVILILAIVIIILSIISLIFILIDSSISLLLIPCSILTNGLQHIILGLRK